MGMQILLQEQTNKQATTTCNSMFAHLLNMTMEIMDLLVYAYFCNGENGYPCFTPILVLCLLGSNYTKCSMIC